MSNQQFLKDSASCSHIEEKSQRKGRRIDIVKYNIWFVFTRHWILPVSQIHSHSRKRRTEGRGWGLQEEEQQKRIEIKFQPGERKGIVSSLELWKKPCFGNRVIWYITTKAKERIKMIKFYKLIYQLYTSIIIKLIL